MSSISLGKCLITCSAVAPSNIMACPATPVVCTTCNRSDVNVPEKLMCLSTWLPAVAVFGEVVEPLKGGVVEEMTLSAGVGVVLGL